MATPFLDPITNSVLDESLRVAVREMTITMVRTSRSPVFSIARDFSCGLTDDQGQLLIVEEGLPVHVIGAGEGIKAMLKFFEGEINDGDVIGLNDPMYGNNHIPDFMVATPIFWNKEIVFYCFNKAHWADTGGTTPGGYTPDATELYHEGIRVPPLKLYDKGEMRRDVVNLLMKNVRFEIAQLGDLRAQIGSLMVAKRRLLGLLQKYGGETIKAWKGSLLTLSEQRIRECIDALPDGKYTGESVVDNIGTKFENLVIKVTVTVLGNEMTVDFTGTSPQVRFYVNSPLSNTQAGVLVALFTVFDPSLPHNIGALRPVNIIAPPGTLVNINTTVPCGQSTIVVYEHIIEAVWTALSQATDDTPALWPRIVAGMSTGVNPRDNMPYVGVNTNSFGGSGAVRGNDGRPQGALSCLFAMPNPDIELHELATSQLVLEREFITDSFGFGEWCGSPGIRYRYTPVGHTAVHTVHGDGNFRTLPQGRKGGLAPLIADKMYKELADGTKIEQRPNSVLTIEPGESFWLETIGGGGWGNPRNRNRQKLKQEIMGDLLSVQAAKEYFGYDFDQE